MVRRLTKVRSRTSLPAESGFFMAFTDIYYQGKKVTPHNVKAKVGQILVGDHLYLMSWYGYPQDGTKSRHACLHFGVWCLKHFKEKPRDLLFFLKHYLHHNLFKNRFYE